MLTIVVLAHRVPYPPNKGEKLRTFHQIEALVALGYKVKVLAPFDNDDDKENAIALSKLFNIEVTTERLSNRALRLFGALLTSRSFSECHFFNSILKSKFEETLTKADAVLLSASSLVSYLDGLDTSGKTILMDFMDVDSDKWMQYSSQSNFPLNYIYSREAKKVSELEDKAINLCDACFVISVQEAKLLQSRHEQSKTIKILGNGIDQRLFNPKWEKPENKFSILFSGVMDYKPNVDAVLWFVEHCWRSICKEIDNAEFVIAGMNPNPEIIRLGQIKGVVVTGFVEDIKPYFDQAQVFVAPFRIARGVQNKVLQAMACGLPVVSTALGAEGIDCENGEDILLAEDTNDFTANIIELHQDSDKARQLGQNALDKINSKYAWSSVLVPLLDILSKHEKHS